MIVQQYVAKRALRVPSGKVYGFGDVVPKTELNEAGIPMLLQAGHMVEVYKEVQETALPVDDEPEANSPADLGFEKPKKRGRKPK